MRVNQDLQRAVRKAVPRPIPSGPDMFRNLSLGAQDATADKPERNR